MLNNICGSRCLTLFRLDRRSNSFNISVTHSALTSPSLWNNTPQQSPSNGGSMFDGSPPDTPPAMVAPLLDSPIDRNVPMIALTPPTTPTLSTSSSPRDTQSSLFNSASSSASSPSSSLTQSRQG